MPVTNSGIELPTIMAVLAATSRLDPGFSAASTPIGTATVTTTMRLKTPNSTVAGMRRSNRRLIETLSLTPWPVLTPRSPCNAWNNQSTVALRQRIVQPQACRGSCSRCSGVASSPAPVNRGIAGQQGHEQEDEHADDPQDDQRGAGTAW